jgi:radical SAM superfamily enzyme YgiQ (UPF0313 family)
MKVTFLVPPVLFGKREVERVFGCTYGIYPFPNIFILYCVSVLRKSHSVRYRDFAVDRRTREDFLGFLRDDDSDMYCFYTVNLAQKTDLDAAGMIRSVRGDRPYLVFLGPRPTHKSEEFLMDERTFVVRGEMEEGLSRLADHLSRDSSPNGIPGISYRNGGGIVHGDSAALIEPLDDLPFPARDVLDPSRYYNPKLTKKPFTAIITSRGCPYPCRYCVPSSMTFARELEYKAHNPKKPPVRLRSVENIDAELREIHEAGYRSVSILDDQFIWGKKRTLDIIGLMGKYGFDWGCLARADLVDEDIGRALAENGCSYIDIGVESFHQEVLDDIKKDIDVKRMIDSLNILKRYKVPMKFNMLVGSSALETEESIRESIRIARGFEPESMMISICNPFPGTDFWDESVEQGWLIGDTYRPVDVQKEATIQYPHLPKKKLEEIVRSENRKFFLRPRFILKNIWRITTPSSLREMGVSLYRKLVS